jgi:hypothetical protein
MSFFAVPDRVRDAWPSGARDFDFLQGEWIIHHRRRPHWQQAFSADGGHSWEINWHMSFRRPNAV